MLIRLAILLAALWVMLAILVSATRVIRRRRAAASASKASDEFRCRCGYLLNHLSVLRCPECGRVPGFESTADELGLTEEQLRRAADKRHERGQNGST